MRRAHSRFRGCLLRLSRQWLRRLHLGSRALAADDACATFSLVEDAVGADRLDHVALDLLLEAQVARCIFIRDQRVRGMNVG